MNRITNRRWALSAFGTASSAALGPGDTVYSVTPPYHPSGLLMSLGGAIAGGARLAMARHFDAATFWEEVRRYGVTVASYTWTMVHDLVEAPPQPGRASPPGAAVHRIGDAARDCGGGSSSDSARPGCSSSMPRPRRGRSSSISAASSAARWAGRCPGAPRSGSPRTTSTAGGLIVGEDGFAQRCGTDEVGMLLARVRPSDPLSVDAPARCVRGW